MSFARFGCSVPSRRVLIQRFSHSTQKQLYATMDVTAVAECKELVDSGYTYLDVRTPEELVREPLPIIEGSVNVPMKIRKDGELVNNEDFLKIANEKFDKDARLVVACRSGNRSTLAVNALEADGFTNLKNFKGGYLGLLAEAEGTA